MIQAKHIFRDLGDGRSHTAVKGMTPLRPRLGGSLISAVYVNGVRKFGCVSRVGQNQMGV